MEPAFYLSSLVAVLAALRVTTHVQPVHALLYLIVSLLAIACVFFSLGAYFAGALEIIIYAGAIMVLFVFVVMIMNMSMDSDKQERAWLHRPQIWVGPSILSCILLAVLVHALVGIGNRRLIKGEIIDAKIVGIALFGPYVLAVEIASMLLLAGLVCAFHLGRNGPDNIDVLYKGLRVTKSTKRQGERGV